MAEAGRAILDDWRQGDLALTPIRLPVLVVDDDGVAAIKAIEAEFGVALVSQSCDVIRRVEDKPFVQVAALTRVNADEMERIKKFAVPSMVNLPVIESQMLAVDLDIITTVQKVLVRKWPRTPGCAGDAEQRRFAGALGRHRQRFAFPDNFNELIKPVRRWLEDKRSSQSPFGNFVRAIREVRVTTDNWHTPKSLLFTLLLDEPPPQHEIRDWEKALATLADKGSHVAYPVPEFRLATYHDISANEFLLSDRLDLDGLSDA